MLYAPALETELAKTCQRLLKYTTDESFTATRSRVASDTGAIKGTEALVASCASIRVGARQLRLHAAPESAGRHAKLALEGCCQQRCGFEAAQLGNLAQGRSRRLKQALRRLDACAADLRLNGAPEQPTKRPLQTMASACHRARNNWHADASGRVGLDPLD